MFTYSFDKDSIKRTSKDYTLKEARKLYISLFGLRSFNDDKPVLTLHKQNIDSFIHQSKKQFGLPIEKEEHFLINGFIIKAL